MLNVKHQSMLSWEQLILLKKTVLTRFLINFLILFLACRWVHKFDEQKPHTHSLLLCLLVHMVTFRHVYTQGLQGSSRMQVKISEGGCVLCCGIIEMNEEESFTGWAWLQRKQRLQAHKFKQSVTSKVSCFYRSGSFSQCHSPLSLLLPDSNQSKWWWQKCKEKDRKRWCLYLFE